MPYSNYIFEYYAAIKSGKITAGRWILAAYRMIIDGLEKSAFFFDARKANKAVQFIEGFCHHFEGGEGLLKLELWQKALVSCMFGIVDSDGLRMFREVFVVIGRKNGKTILASAIMAYMAYKGGTVHLRYGNDAAGRNGYADFSGMDKAVLELRGI